MKEETKNLIKQVAEKIDEDKYNPILTSIGYAEYLENILLLLCEGVIDLEESITTINKNKDL